MFHTIYKSNIVHCGKHLFQQTRYCRAADSVLTKGRLIHHERTSKTSNEPSIHKFSSIHYNLVKKNYRGEKEQRQRFSHSNQVSMLFGIMGTAAVLGMGSALCETHEENTADNTLPRNSNETSKKPDTSSEQIVDVRDIYPTGEDVVGTERNTYKNKKISQGPIANVQNVNESSSMQASYNSQREKLSVQEAVEKSHQLLKRCMEEAGAPGLVVAVSVDGVTVWADGFGYADVENSVQCSSNTVMRIASISKSMTMTAVAKLWEEGKLDLDAPIQKYIPSFPVKTYNGEEVTITTRHLISHKSGIRHYKLKGQSRKEKEEDDKEKLGKKEKAKDDKEKLGKREKAKDDKEKLSTMEKEKDDKEKLGTKEKEEDDKEKLGTKEKEEDDKEKLGTKEKEEDDKEKLGTKEKEEDDKEKLGTKEKEEDNKEKLSKKEKEKDNKEKKKLTEISIQEDENKKKNETEGKHEKDSNISTNEEIRTENEKESSNIKETRSGHCGSTLTMAEQKKKELDKVIKAKANKKRKGKKKEEENEFDLQEYYIKEEFETIQEALELFQNDDLFFKPGSDFLYTTHGWTVVSGVVEGASRKPFTKVISRLFYDMGLQNTYLDQNTPIIYNRARYYVRDKHGRLKNAPYVDNSYKWGGGGFLSTALDLTKFGNAMLYASQQENEVGKEGSNRLPGFLKASTMRTLWTPVKGTSVNWIRDEGYGMGWVAVEEKCSYGFCQNSRPYASHTGGAVGASSVLHILPKQVSSNKESGNPPKGIVVAVMTNMKGVGLGGVALQIAQLFENVQ